MVRNGFRGDLKIRSKPDGQLILAGDSHQLDPVVELKRPGTLAFMAALWSGSFQTWICQQRFGYRIEYR